MHSSHTSTPLWAARQTDKIYCYVDESGQETQGRLFVVAVVLTGPERDKLLQIAEEIEQQSSKNILKWHKTRLSRKIQYITAVLTRPEFADCLYFARFTDTKDYLDATVKATAAAIALRAPARYKATVVVDALRDSEITRFARALRHRAIRIRKIRGARDESNPLVRLADAIAGFIRDYLEDQPYTRDLGKMLKNVKEIKAK